MPPPSGGTIGGNLTVNGNLTVTGTITGTSITGTSITGTGDITTAASAAIGWSDAAFFRNSAGVVDFGNSASHTSGWLQASRFIAMGGSANFTAGATGTATSGANFGSNSLIFSGSSWNGSAAQVDNWTASAGENAGTNPTPFLLLGGPSRSQQWQLVLSTSVAANSGLNVNGPDIMLRGNYWNGGAGTIDDWHLTPTLGSGTNPASTLVIAHSGTPGPAAVQLPLLQLGANDLGLSRDAANILACGNGVIGNKTCTSKAGNS
jgi:hypothetical protein